MKVLWIKTELLHPVDKGGRIRTFQMLRALRRDHEVIYLTLDDGTADPDALLKASEYATTVITVPFHPPQRMSGGYLIDVFGNLFSRLPYAVARYESSAMRAKVRKLAPAADIVICDFLAPSQNVPVGLATPTVLFQHNVEAQIWARHAEVASNPVWRAYMQVQWRRMRAFESAECRRFQHVVAVSEQDAAHMRKAYGAPSVSSVGTGVDMDYFAPIESPRDPDEILFVGTMDWMPNDDGVRWFLEQILPLIRQRRTKAKFTVVGRRPSATLERVAASMPGVTVTGTVPDVRPYLARARLSVVPLRVGGGTRLKIYEAMAMGIPIVSTAIGAEGLPVADGEHLLIADSPAQQADAICRLLDDDSMAASIARNALQFVRQHASWAAVSSQFINDCAAACGL